MIKKVFLFISIILITNKLLANTPPTIFNFRIEASEPNKVYFDSDKPITGSSTDGFTISNRSISGITISSGQLSSHYFTVTESFSYWDNNTIRYEGGSNIKDENGNSLFEFTLSYIKNKIPEPDASQDRYVTTSATGGGDGLTESTAWTWDEAFSRANAGMTVWIKAGDYGNLNLAIYNDGTSVSPIKFIGYKESTGDITSNYYDYGVTWDSSEMPTLTGYSPDDGVAIQPMGIQYVIFRNIQVSNYSHGIQATTTYNSHLVFDRINGNNFGSEDSSGSSAFSTFINFETFSDDTKYWNNNGPFSGNDNMKFLNLRCLNAGLAGLYVVGDGNNLVDGCKTYSDRVVGLEVMDYQISINGHNNIVRNCYVENFNTTRSNVSTHGIGVRGDYNHFGQGSTYNLIEKSKAVNINEGFYVRNYGSNHNVIKDCEVSNNANGANYLNNLHENTGGVAIWGGSDYNIIERVKVSNTSFGIIFYDNQEDKHPSLLIGKGNQIRNCVFNKTRYMMVFDAENSIGAILEDTKIINCTFNDAHGFMKNYYAVNKNFEMINCQITNVNKASAKNPATDNDPNMNYNGVSFKNCNFFGNVGNWYIAGSGNTNDNPQYISETDLQLSSSTSTEITEGGSYERLVPFDIDGKYRGDVFSIGAYQYGESTTGAIRANAGEDTEICSGEEVTLTATGNGNFSWNTGETTASITVSPEETTTYTVTVSDGENSESDEVIVTVNESPTVSVGDDVTICAGNEITLTAEGIGDFLWSNGETTKSITVSPTETSTYTVTASNDCDSQATDEIIVNVTEDLSLNLIEDVTMCSGNEVTLTAESNGELLWSTGETTASITVSPTEETLYSVTATSGDCSLTKEVTVLITELPEVNLGDDLAICAGNEITLTAEGVGEFLWNTGENSKSITINPTETTTYTVTASVTCGEESVSVSDEITITVTPGIILNAGEDVSICSGEEVTLTAEGNQDFLWSTGETTASITVNPTETTTYSVSSSVDGGCTATDNVIVTVGDEPEVSLGEDITITSGEEITITAEGSGDFLWSTGETTESITVSPTENTTYSVTASNTCGEDVSDEINIIVTEVDNSELTVNAGEDVTICEGEEVTLTAEGNGNFTWSTGETTASITVSPNDNTTYTVTVSRGNESLSDEVNVNVNKLPSVSLGEDINICYGEEVVLRASGSGSFLWSNGKTSARIRVSPLETTTYSVTVTDDSCGVTVTDEIIVNVGKQIIVDAGEDKTICTGESVTLIAQGNGDFKWSTGETTASITVSPNSPKTYWVTSTIGDCSVSDDVYVKVEKAPTVTLEEDKTICSGQQITLIATGTGDFLWNTGETTSSILISPNQTTVYSVTSSSHCSTSATDEITVTVKESVTANAGNDVTIESGDLVTLTATGGTVFLWSTGETTASIDVQPNETTVYTVEVGAEASCRGTDDVKVTIKDIPLTINNGEDVTICIGDELILQAQGSSNYLWNTGEMDSAITVKPQQTTTYSVSAQKKGILETVEIIVTVENCSSNKKEEFITYPNPTQGIVNIHLPSQKTKLMLNVISLNGKVIYTKEVKADDNGVFTQIDLSNMKKGVYLLRMFNENFNETKKILVI